MYEAKHCVEALLWILVRNLIGLHTREEVATFLDMTPNRKAFQRQRQLASAVAVFRNW